jgi:hypothetical protein
MGESSDGISGGIYYFVFQGNSGDMQKGIPLTCLQTLVVVPLFSPTYR